MTKVPFPCLEAHKSPIEPSFLNSPTFQLAMAVAISILTAVAATNIVWRFYHASQPVLGFTAILIGASSTCLIYCAFRACCPAAATSPIKKEDEGKNFTSSSIVEVKQDETVQQSNDFLKPSEIEEFIESIEESEEVDEEEDCEESSEEISEEFKKPIIIPKKIVPLWQVPLEIVEDKKMGGICRSSLKEQLQKRCRAFLDAKWQETSCKEEMGKIFQEILAKCNESLKSNKQKPLNRNEFQEIWQELKQISFLVEFKQFLQEKSGLKMLEDKLCSEILKDYLTPLHSFPCKSYPLITSQLCYEIKLFFTIPISETGKWDEVVLKIEEIFAFKPEFVTALEMKALKIQNKKKEQNVRAVDDFKNLFRELMSRKTCKERIITLMELLAQKLPATEDPLFEEYPDALEEMQKRFSKLCTEGQFFPHCYFNRLLDKPRLDEALQMLHSKGYKVPQEVVIEEDFVSTFLENLNASDINMATCQLVSFIESLTSQEQKREVANQFLNSDRISLENKELLRPHLSSIN